MKHGRGRVWYDWRCRRAPLCAPHKKLYWTI